MKKIIIAILIIAGLGAGTFFGLNVSKDSTSPQVLSSTSQNDTQHSSDAKASEEASVSFGVPTRLSIPSIDVDTDVESIGQDENGGMDVPKNFKNAGWYNLGVKPGEAGNAVFAGHYDRVDGSPAAFWDVPKLKIGDKIHVFDNDGNKLIYSVVRLSNYKHDAFPLEEVFGASSKKRLNLITCQGNWDEKTKLYSERMVVYSELEE